MHDQEKRNPLPRYTAYHYCRILCNITINGGESIITQLHIDWYYQYYNIP